MMMMVMIIIIPPPCILQFLLLYDPYSQCINLRRQFSFCGCVCVYVCVFWHRNEIFFFFCSTCMFVRSSFLKSTIFFIVFQYYWNVSNCFLKISTFEGVVFARGEQISSPGMCDSRGAFRQEVPCGLQHRLLSEKFRSRHWKRSRWFRWW